MLRVAKQTGTRPSPLFMSYTVLSANLADGLFRDPIDGADLALGFTYAALDDISNCH